MPTRLFTDSNTLFIFPLVMALNLFTNKMKTVKASVC